MMHELWDYLVPRLRGREGRARDARGTRTRTSERVRYGPTLGEG